MFETVLEAFLFCTITPASKTPWRLGSLRIPEDGATLSFSSNSAQLNTRAKRARAAQRKKQQLKQQQRQRALDCLLLCPALYDPRLPFSHALIDGIVCVASIDVHSLALRTAKSSVFMLVETLWHARQVRHCWG